MSSPDELNALRLKPRPAWWWEDAWHLRERCHIHTNTLSPPKQSLCNSSRPVGAVIVVIMLKLMLHGYSCVSCIVIRFFFSPSTEVSFKCFFGAWRLMTTCFPTEMFNQRLIRGTDTFGSADLIFHFPFWCATFINLQSRGDEEGEVSVRLLGAHWNALIFHALTYIGWSDKAQIR